MLCCAGRAWQFRFQPGAVGADRIHQRIDGVGIHGQPRDSAVRRTRPLAGPIPHRQGKLCSWSRPALIRFCSALVVRRRPSGLEDSPAPDGCCLESASAPLRNGPGSPGQALQKGCAAATPTVLRRRRGVRLHRALGRLACFGAIEAAEVEAGPAIHHAVDQLWMARSWLRRHPRSDGSAWVDDGGDGPGPPDLHRSIRRIREALGCTGLDPLQQQVLERLVHSSGDLSLGPLLRFSPGACEAGPGCKQGR